MKLLREVDPAEAVGKDDGPDEVMALSGELARVESSIALIEADMNENGESPVLFRRLRGKEQLKQGLAARLADARQRAASPLSEAWGQMSTLMDALDAAPDPVDARLRLRAGLRRVVSEIRLLVVPRHDPLGRRAGVFRRRLAARLSNHPQGGKGEPVGAE